MCFLGDSELFRGFTAGAKPVQGDPGYVPRKILKDMFENYASRYIASLVPKGCK